MEPANNYLDELVRKAFPEEDTRSDNAALWDSIDKTLKYKGFLRFSLSHFNIYYSVLIVVIISSASYLFINNNNSQNTPPLNNNSIKLVPTVKDSSQQELKNEATVSSIQQTGNAQNIQNQSSGKSDKNSLAVVNNKTDKPSSPTGDTGSRKTKKIKVVKKQLVITDTVHKKDTVYIKKHSP
ncbi:MAG: hypothetical protein ABR968_09425 [Bacteroidales bacterium]|jgi:hypothetical protein